MTLAALALPGLLPSAVQASDGNELGFQYEHYAEGERSLHGYNSRFEPLEVTSLRAAAALDLSAAWHASLDFEQDTWAGATPVTTLPLAAMTRLSDAEIVAGASAKPSTGQIRPSLVDAALAPYVDAGSNPFQPLYARDERVIHMMTSASPETRKQGQGNLTYAWERAALSAGGGVSHEPDYAARFVSLLGRFDFNRKLTSVEVGLSRTWAETAVTLPDTWQGWVDSSIGEGLDEIRSAGSFANGSPKYVVANRRRDYAGTLSVSQVLSRSSLLQLGLGYTRNSGYLENSYRVESFLTRGPAAPRSASDGTPLYFASLFHTYEQRPDLRQQWLVNLRVVQHLAAVGAALHGDYRYFRDDWGIRAHTLETSWEQPLGHGWTLTPHVRYYSQSAAEFYRPFVRCGEVAGVDCALALRNYSSDYRLSGFGALSGGVGLAKLLTRGVSIELSGDYYTHRGALKLGGGGEGGYADFDTYALNAALRIDTTTLAECDADRRMSARSTAHHSQRAQHSHDRHHSPPGVMAAHSLARAGDFMLGYRYMYASQSGAMQHGSATVSDAAVVVNGGCDGAGCSVRPRDMHMHMHMVDVMYAVTDRLSLMMMPQFVDMNMGLTPLAGGPQSLHSTHSGHQSGGMGDTEVAAVMKLFDGHTHRLHVALGLSAPSGDSGIRLNPVAGHSHDPSTVRQSDYLHYGMQLGSGTWDLLPRLTLSGGIGAWRWGAQLGGIKRLEHRNEAGYALGSQFQATSWAGVNLFDCLTLSLRGVYTEQGKVRGRFHAHREQDVVSGVTSAVENAITGPMDATGNYGGRYWDLGLGLELHMPRGALAGSQLGVEWLLPLTDDLNGYQTARDAALVVSWSHMF